MRARSSCWSRQRSARGCWRRDCASGASTSAATPACSPPSSSPGPGIATTSCWPCSRPRPSGSSSRRWPSTASGSSGRPPSTGWRPTRTAFAPGWRPLAAPSSRSRPPGLLGADGAHSAVRAALGLPFHGTTDPLEWWLVDVRMDWPFAPGEMSIFAWPAAVLAVIPIEPGLFRLVSNGPEPRDLLPRGAIVQEEVWRSAFRISYRQVESY